MSNFFIWQVFLKCQLNKLSKILKDPVVAREKLLMSRTIYSSKKKKKREKNINIFDKMDGPWGHYAKWNNSDKDKYSMI